MISTIYICRTGDDPNAQILVKRLQSEGFDILQDLIIEKTFRLEGITQQQADSLRPLLCHPKSETMTTRSSLDITQGPIVEVGYQRAVTDPELPSILRGAKSLGVNELKWVRIAHRYQFLGIDAPTAEQIVTRYLYNPQVQVLISPDEEWETLKPRGEAGPVVTVPLSGFTADQLVTLSESRRLFLNVDQMQTLQQISQQIGRDLTDAEVEMFAQTWSDHCFHTTWKSLGLLQALWETTTEINHPLVLSVFEDNAGAMTFYEGWALTIKGETHNSPSAVSPYGGIMTKHGGVIRDTLGCGQGAKPIGGSTVMGLGDPRMAWQDVPKGALHPKTILVDSIRGTADYTNPMGIPMMFPVYRFHNGYTGKCFALGHSIGFVPAERAKKGHPKPGDIAILIGGLTGRDGLHGATVSSSSMTSETATVDAAHVQIGHPIEERVFMEAIPVLRDNNCLRAITDLGAAGLSSAAGEMGSETGVWINLAWIPLKTEGMHPWEIWISESQERMLLCVPPGKVEDATAILTRYEVHTSRIGKFTETHRCQVIYDPLHELDLLELSNTPNLTGEIVVDLEFKELRKGCPLPKIDLKQPPKKTDTMVIPIPKSEEEWKSVIFSVLGHLNSCDQSAAGFQYDKTIQGIVSTGPYGGIDGRMPNDVWAATPIHGKPYGAVTALGFNPLYGDVDPVQMARLMMIESITKLVAFGVNPSEIVLCDNFYTPRVTNEIAWALKHMVLACCELSTQLGTPFISGKDSSSGTFIGEDGNRLDIPPTLAVLAMGRMEDIRQSIPKSWQRTGNRLMLVGPLSPTLGGSIYLDTLNQRGSELPQPSVSALKEFWKALIPFQPNQVGEIRSASAIGEGGLIRRLFEMALGSGRGCSIDLQSLNQRLGSRSSDYSLFGEMIGAVLIEVPEAHCQSVEDELQGILLGHIVKDKNLTINTGKTIINLSMDKLISVWEKPFQEVAR